MLKSPGKSKTDKPISLSTDGTLWSKNADKEPAVLLQLEIREHTMNRGRIKNKLLTVFQGRVTFCWDSNVRFFAEIISSEPFGGGGPIREQE